MALTYHISARGTPGTLIYITGSDGVSRGTVIPAMTLDDGTGTGSPLGSAANPLNVTSGSGASSNQVQGNVASGTADSGNPVKIGGPGSTAAPTAVTTGQRVNAWYGLNGQAASFITNTSGATAAVTSPTSDGFSAQSGLATYSQGVMFNGLGWDRQRKPNNFSRLATSAATGSPTSVKASAGDVMQFWGQNAAAVTYLQIYNKASAPVLGTDTPVLTYPIPASTVFSQTIPNGGAYLNTGVAYAFTTDAAGTTASAANAVTSFAMLVA